MARSDEAAGGEEPAAVRGVVLVERVGEGLLGSLLLERLQRGVGVLRVRLQDALLLWVVGGNQTSLQAFASAFSSSSLAASSFGGGVAAPSARPAVRHPEARQGR
jgi:hypothetical protein